MQEIAVLDVTRVWLAAVFGGAGVLKAYYPATATLYVMRVTGISERAAKRIVEWVCAMEVGISASLLSGLFVAGAAGVSVLMLLGFILVLVRDTRGENGECGCFGPFSTRPYRRLEIVRNLVMLAAAAFILRDGYGGPFWNPAPHPLAFGLGFVIAGVSALSYVAVSRWHVIEERGS
jgi:hypothetical protein